MIIDVQRLNLFALFLKTSSQLSHTVLKQRILCVYVELNACKNDKNQAKVLQVLSYIYLHGLCFSGVTSWMPGR